MNKTNSAMTQANAANLPSEFQSFLEGGKSLSPQSIKNYVSDINIFLNWLKLSIQETEIKPEHVTSTNINAYREELNNSRQSLAVKNRYLSSLRRFGHFLFATNLTPTNPAQHLLNADPTISGTSTREILAAFKHDLNNEGLSPTTIKNYLSDVKQYLKWASNPTTNTINNR